MKCLVFTCPLLTCCSGGDAHYDSHGAIDAVSESPIWRTLEGEGHMHVSEAAVTHCR